MRVAIVGSRDCGSHHKRMTEILKVLREYGKDAVVISGGARGIDWIGFRCAIALGLECRDYLPNWEMFGKKAGFMRNQQIVDNCDEVHAWWDGKSRGTADTIRRARKAGKPVIIHEIKATK